MFPYGLYLHQSLRLPLLYHFVRQLLPLGSLAQGVQAAVYQPEDIRRQLASFPGFFLDILNDGLPILAKESCILSNEFSLGPRDNGGVGFHGRSYSLDLIQVLLP